MSHTGAREHPGHKESTAQVQVVTKSILIFFNQLVCITIHLKRNVLTLFNFKIESFKIAQTFLNF